MDLTIQQRYERVCERLSAACVKAVRDPQTVRLLAVSKTHGPDEVEEVAACGQTVFGENRIQEARQKIPLCSSRLEWHLVGHLQTNKVKEAVRCFRMIHSVDSLRLLEAIDQAGGLAGGAMPVCLEVNVAGEASKFGLAPDAVPSVLEAANRLHRIAVVGLMTIPPITEDPEQVRPCFRRLRDLRDECRAKTGFELPELSMGMSHDFEVAIEEGATWVRVGTDLFGPRRAVRPVSPDE